MIKQTLLHLIEIQVNQEISLKAAYIFAYCYWLRNEVLGVVNYQVALEFQDAISAAGGFNEEANDSSINLARELTDGEQVVVGSISY